MHSTLKNILAIIIGWIAGSIVNMSLIAAGSKVFPIKGINPNDMEAYAEIMPSLGSKHFLFPFLAHALGTLVGAAIAYLIATNHKMKFAYAIGCLFLLGGIAVNYMLPGPIWFTMTDILIAYIPMAWLGGKITKKILIKK
jgi:hypothetical protein